MTQRRMLPPEVAEPSRRSGRAQHQGMMLIPPPPASFGIAIVDTKL